MNLDEYKIIDLDEIYNFLVDYLGTRMTPHFYTKIYTNSNFISKAYVDYLVIRMTPHEETLNYKGVDLIEIYNFGIDLISI
jgi:hypothetical protein